MAHPAHFKADTEVSGSHSPSRVSPDQRDHLKSAFIISDASSHSQFHSVTTRTTPPQQAPAISNYDANLKSHVAMHANQKPSVTHKIAHKLGMHKDHHHHHGHGVEVVGPAHPHGHKHHNPLTHHHTGHHTGHHAGHHGHHMGHHDNDPNHVHAHDPVIVHDKHAKPGIVHKVADKLHLHKGHKHHV